MSIQFFDFGNSETFHFFRRVSESGKVNPADVIERAFKQAETSEWLKIGENVSIRSAGQAHR
jgi:hypothetical protein